MKTQIKKTFRFFTYSALVGFVGLISFLFSRNNAEYNVTLNPLSDIEPASADVPRSAGGDEGSDSGSGDSSGDM